MCVYKEREIKCVEEEGLRYTPRKMGSAGGKDIAMW